MQVHTNEASIIGTSTGRNLCKTKLRFPGKCTLDKSRTNTEKLKNIQRHVNTN